jgi:L-aspartate oxidase
MRADVLIIGSGLAGLACALALDVRRTAILVNDTQPASDVASAWAQGGVAAALAADDAPALHAADTLAAAGGIADRATVDALAADAPQAIALLESFGVPFDRDADGELALGLEAAHSRRRIAHAADHTGASIVAALLAAVARRPNVTLVTGLRAFDLISRDDGSVGGARFVNADGGVIECGAAATVVASGGYGGLFARTTTPAATLGAGIAMAARAGATLADLEFVQFHPTALAGGGDPLPLVSEAVRGEGAVLIDEHGQRFVDELLPRDVVARAIFAVEERGGSAALDARALGARFARRFPTIDARARALGIDAATMPLPVTPAAHYTIGGIATGATGRTDVAGLWACGEVAATGLHGANRLASNSLMEALVFGTRVAGDIGATALPRRSIGSVRPPQTIVLADDLAAVLRPLREAMSAFVGVVRDARGLNRALAACDALAASTADPRALDAADVARRVIEAALARRESRGAHYRRDFPATDPRQAVRSFNHTVAAVAQSS